MVLSVGDCMELHPLSFWPYKWELRDTVMRKVIASNTSSTVPCFFLLLLLFVCLIYATWWGTHGGL